MTKKEKIFNLNEWLILTPEERIEQLTKTKTKQITKGSHWLNDGSIKPIDLYCYLVSRFGKPSGIMMLARGDSTENLFHWHFTIKIEDSNIEILNSNHGTEFSVQCTPPFTNNDWELLMKKIKEDFKDWGTEMSQVRKKLDKWTLFINPFARINRVTNKMYDELSEIKIKEPFNFPILPTQKQYDKFLKEMETWRKNLHRSVILGLNLRMLAPIMAEAFINLLLFYLAKDDIKQDQRVFDSILRDEIDLRVRKLHLHCIGFSKPINTEHGAFKDFQTLINQRNDLLHGNIDPRRLVFENVFLDGTIPIFPKEDLLPIRLVRNLLSRIEPKAALNDIKVVRNFINHVLSFIEEPYKKDVQIIMDEQQLGWCEEKGEVGILFSKVIPLGIVMSPEK